MTIGTRTNQARSLRNYRTCMLTGRSVATELKPSSVATQRPSVCPARSLCSDRARAKIDRYVATERASHLVAMQRPSSSQARSLRSNRASVPLSRYVTTKRAFCLVATQRLSSSETSIRYQSMHSRLSFDAISRRPQRTHFMFSTILSHQSNFTVKTVESLFFIEKNHNKHFELEDGPKGPKT